MKDFSGMFIEPRSPTLLEILCRKWDLKNRIVIVSVECVDIHIVIHNFLQWSSLEKIFKSHPYIITLDLLKVLDVQLDPPFHTVYLSWRHRLYNCLYVPEWSIRLDGSGRGPYYGLWL